MKIIAVIPARYQSSRFPGKPLANICGKPMIWWVHQQVKKVQSFADVYVATDDERVVAELKKNSIPYIVTREDHPDHISRIHEVSCKIAADLYVCINGDEPLIDEDCIQTAITHAQSYQQPAFYGSFRYLSDPAETIDSANIKVVTDKEGKAIYLSRTPIPFPKNDLSFQYKKYVGIECFDKAALDFFISAPQGELEKIEDIDHLRFIENDFPCFFSEVKSDSISVDMPKDLEKVRKIMERRLKLEKNEY